VVFFHYQSNSTYFLGDWVRTPPGTDQASFPFFFGTALHAVLLVQSVPQFFLSFPPASPWPSAGAEGLERSALLYRGCVAVAVALASCAPAGAQCSPCVCFVCFVLYRVIKPACCLVSGGFRSRRQWVDCLAPVSDGAAFAAPDRTRPQSLTRRPRASANGTAASLISNRYFFTIPGEVVSERAGL